MLRSRFGLLLLLGLLALAGCKSGGGDPGPGDEDATVEPGQDQAVATADGPVSPGKDGGVPATRDGATPSKDGAAKKDTGTTKKDAATTKKDAGAADTLAADYTSPNPTLSGPPTATKVAAVQYAEGQASLVKAACASATMPDVCAVKELVQQARQAGASLVITPEYGLGQKYYELSPKVGENPGQSAAWDSDSLIKTFSYQAKQLGIYLLIDLLTAEGTSGSYKYYNTLIAFGPDGAVLAVHHKFNLFGGESKTLTAGSDIAVIQTPLGKIALLICADIYGSSTIPNKVKTLGARIAAISSYWTVGNPITSYYLPFAKSYGVYVIVSNTTDSSAGPGGVIGALTGTAIQQVKQTTPSVLLGDIPLPP